MRLVRSNTVEGGKAIKRLVNRSESGSQKAEKIARNILADVRCHGDQALLRYARKLDGLSGPIRVSQEEMRTALSEIRRTDPAFLGALRAAADNIRRFAQWQRPKDWMRQPRSGIRVGQIVRPLDSVGCYVPGGRYPLPSTLLMSVIPAQVAGVSRIVVVSPKPAPQTLATAALLGVTEFYRIGGAQAIAALAYGTLTVSAVDKIVGPGNSFVTAAKKLSGCPIDMLAGPTEALIVSHNGNPTFIAADLVAQAEHDLETSVAFVTTSMRLADAVRKEVSRLSADNPTAKKALNSNALIIVARSRKESMEIANGVASEHLTVEAGDADNVRAAGSLFIGDYSAQSFGDYFSGPNHVLPTAGLARARGGLSVSDFVKVITVQQISKSGIKKFGKTVIRLAEAEGLRAHADSVALRIGGTRA